MTREEMIAIIRQKTRGMLFVDAVMRQDVWVDGIDSAADAILSAQAQERGAEDDDPTEGLPGKLTVIVSECANGRPINGGDLELIEEAARRLDSAERGVDEEVVRRLEYCVSCPEERWDSGPQAAVAIGVVVHKADLRHLLAAIHPHAGLQKIGPGHGGEG